MPSNSIARTACCAPGRRISGRRIVAIVPCGSGPERLGKPSRKPQRSMPFTTTVIPNVPATYAIPLLAVALPAGGLPASLNALDASAGGALGRLLAAGDFKGKKDETAL